MPGDAELNPIAEHAPPGWPRAEHPLRVGLLGWARLSFQGNQGSGYNLSCSELAAGLALMGHRPFYLASGRRYDLSPRMSIRHTEHWRGVECFDLFNSPNISPASYNFRNMVAEADHPEQVRLVRRWVSDHHLDVVHVHSLEGFPLSLIGALREQGVPVIVTPHNYWYACPQVDLMRGETKLCMDYDGGRACIGCISGADPSRARLKRRLGHSFEAVVGHEVAALLRRTGKEARDRLHEVRSSIPPDTPNNRDPDVEASWGLSIQGPGPGSDGLVPHHIKERRGPLRRRPVAPVDLHANETFLAGDRHLVVLNEYGQRRAIGLRALDRASLVTPPSDFMGEVYAKMGVSRERIRTVRLGQPHFDQMHRRAKRSPFYEREPWNATRADRPLRLAFFGAMRPSKGIDVLAAAIPMLPREIRQRCHFFIRAHGNDWPLRKPLSVYPEVSWNGGYDLLQLINSAGDYDVGILPHAWFENSPLVLLEHLHAGKFVICSRLGGPVEWVRDGVNGLLVPGGQPQALVDAIARLVRGEVRIPSPQEIHASTPSLESWPGHVRTIAAIYDEVL